MDKKETFRLVKIEPVKDIRELKLWFSIPGTRHLYGSKPGQQLGFVLGHEGEGSLLSYLKDKGWAITLSAGASEFSRDYGAGVVTVGLTEKGLKEYKEVLKATIDYIDLILHLQVLHLEDMTNLEQYPHLPNNHSEHSSL